jgi:hypothetical protein
MLRADLSVRAHSVTRSPIATCVTPASYWPRHERVDVIAGGKAGNPERRLVWQAKTLLTGVEPPSPQPGLSSGAMVQEIGDAIDGH